MHEALGKPLPPHTSSTAEPRKIPIAAIRTLPTDYYDAPTNQRSREARAWDISSPFLNEPLQFDELLQLDEGYDGQSSGYSEEEEESNTEEDAEFEVSSPGYLESVTEDSSGSNTTSADEVASPVYAGESEVFEPARGVELAQDSEGEAGSGVSREKRGRETDKVRESARRKAADEEQDYNDGEDDEEEKPAQVLTYS